MRLRPRNVVFAAAVPALLAGLALTVPSCSDDDPPDDPPPSTTPTTSADEATRAEVEAAYTSYREMADRLLQAPDPDDPEIAERATGETRQRLVESLTSLRDQGRAVRFGDQSQFEIQSIELVSATTATLVDCAVDDARTVDASSGEVLAEGLATGLFSVTLEKDAGRWRVVLTPSAEETWEGISGCAA